MHFWDQHKTITRYYGWLMSSVREKYQLRQMEYDILMFLYNNPQFNTAADIVKVRKSTKSHVSTSLKILEDRGLIVKKTAVDNKKHIEIFLSASANEIIQDGAKAQKQFESRMLRGLSEAEITQCKQAFQKICENAEECMNEERMNKDGSMALAIQKAAHSEARMCCFFTNFYRRKNQPFFFLP